MIKYPVVERALIKWGEMNLELVREKDQLYHYVFNFQGSTCNNGGIEFNAHLNCVVKKYDSKNIIEKAWIDIPEDQKENVSKMCIVPGSVLDKSSEKFTGKSLEEAILEDIPQNYAGCLCQEPMINHKWKMVFSTIHYKMMSEN